MDWQHLIMNGENLAEYAALLAAEGLLGHQHANSGWGTFDDDNMVGRDGVHGDARARASSCAAPGTAQNGERLGFDLYPYTEDAVGAVQALGAAVALHRRRRGQDRRRRAARGAAGEGRGARLRARVRGARRRSARTSRRARRRDDRRQGASPISPTATCSRRAEEEYPLSTPQPRLVRAGSRGLVARDRARCSSGSAPRADRLLGPDARARHARREASACCARRSSGTTSAPPPSAPRSRSGVGLERLIELTGNRALTGFTAPKLLWLRAHEPDVYARIAHVLLPKDYVRLRLDGELAIDAADASGTLLFDVANRRWSERGARRARASRRVAAAVSTSRRRSPARATRPRGRSASASTCPARSRSCSARRASSSACCRPTEPTPRRACTRSAMPCRGRGMRWASCSRRPARCAGCATRSAATTRSSLAEAERWPPGTEGLFFQPYLTGRADAARRPRRARARSSGSDAAARPRRPRSRRARRRRLRAARLARAPARARRSSPRSAGSRAAARAASSGAGSSRACSGCRSSGRRSTRAPPSARRCSPASGPASSPTPTRPWPRGPRDGARRARATWLDSRICERLPALPARCTPPSGLCRTYDRAGAARTSRSRGTARRDRGTARDHAAHQPTHRGRRRADDGDADGSP